MRIISLLSSKLAGLLMAAAVSSAVLTTNSLANESVPAEILLVNSYERLLPLEGGSNFRDMGGYVTVDGKRVNKGLLFRSGAMTSLTQSDITYLEQFDFQTIVDLRSAEELELFPNRWAVQETIDYVNVHYRIMDLMGEALNISPDEENPEQAVLNNMGESYKGFPALLEPQFIALFDRLLAAETPLVVNCSAGQDRTGVASALILSALGVPRETILRDYHLSTELRRPEREQGDVDLQAAAETNAFAAMMLSFSHGEEVSEANPLYTEDGTSFLQFTFDDLEARYGSILAYLDVELGVDAADIARLRELYLD